MKKFWLIFFLVISQGCVELDDDPYSLYYRLSGHENPDVTFDSGFIVFHRYDLGETDSTWRFATTDTTKTSFRLRDSDLISGSFTKTRVKGTRIDTCEYTQLYDLTLHYQPDNTSQTWEGIGGRSGCE